MITNEYSPLLTYLVFGRDAPYDGLKDDGKMSSRRGDDGVESEDEYLGRIGRDCEIQATETAGRSDAGNSRWDQPPVIQME